MAAKEALAQNWPSDEIKEVQKILEELPRRQGAPVMVPFGQVAFFPGELSNAEKVFAEKHLVAAAAAAAAKGSVSATTAAAVAAERGPQIGRGDTALLELPTSEAAALLQQLLPPAQVPQPHPAPQHPPAPAQQAQRVAAKQPTPAEPPVQQAPPPETRQQAQQLSHLVEGRTPEQPEALRAALQQLGAKLEQQAAAAAGGQAPSTEGKEIVDIREEWSEEVHGAATMSQLGKPHPPAAAAASGGAKGRLDADEELIFEGGDSDLLSEDSFEELMQRMEALEMDEAALAEAAAAGAVAAAAPTPGAPPASAGQPGRMGGGDTPGGFKKGFLLGKDLGPGPAGRQAGAPASSQQPAQEAAPAAAAAAGDRQLWEQGEEAARRREAVFSGRVVERLGPGTSPDPTSPTGRGVPAGPPDFPGFAVAERQPQQEQQEQPPLQQQPQRLSRFKQRRVGLL